MSNPFLAEIRIVPFNFAPKGWALCDGQVMAISQNTALFSLLGTTYGGDGQSNFALPDLQGRAPMHAGQGPGLTDRMLGEQAGEDTVTLLTSEMPSHSHTFTAATAAATEPDPEGAVLATSGSQAYGTGSAVAMADAISTAGGGQPHENMQPYLTLNFVIALSGVFPARS